MKKNLLIVLALFSFQICSAQYEVKVYAGTGVAGLKNGALLEANFRHPFGICIDAVGNLYMADNENNCIRKIGVDGKVATFAGSSTKGFKDGNVAQALFAGPTALCFDLDSNLLVTDFENQRIRKISKQGIVSTIAGTGIAGFKDTIASFAQFNYPRGICVDTKGNIYIGDSWNHRIRKIDLNNKVSTFAGGGDTIGVQSKGNYIDAKGPNARFYTPCEIKIAPNNTIYVADAFNHRIRKIDSSSNVTTIAGSGASGNNAGGFFDGRNLEARFNTPTTLYLDSNLDIYLGDGANHRVRKISKDSVSTFAGTGDAGMDDGPADLSTFNFPRGIVKNKNGEMFVVDYNNHSIRKISVLKTIGIGQESISKISISPNPFQTKIIVDMPIQSRYSIFSVEGRLLSWGECALGKNEIDLNFLSKGLYLIRFHELNVSRQLIKQF